MQLVHFGSEHAEKESGFEQLEEAHSHFINEWHNQTTLHPLGATAAIALGIVLLSVHRRYATLPLIIMACFVPSAQRLVLLGADFDLIRILLIFGTARIIARKEYSGFQLSRLDVAIVLWTLASALIPILRIGVGVFVNRLGHVYDVLGMYFIFRCIIRTADDFSGMVKGVMVVSIPIATMFLIESLTRYNIFSVFGGVPSVTNIRDGRLRCQGAFSHPILAGCFWVSLLPLILSQWQQRRSILSVLASLSSLLIIVTCASATPVFGLLVVLLGFLAYPLKYYMWVIRWLLITAVVGLHLAMEAPVWHLIARTSSLGGSSWHRYQLIDGAIRHINEWYLFGSNVGTGHWGHHTFDVTNYYIVQGITGGLLQLTLFLYLIYTGFSIVGRTLRSKRLTYPARPIVWSLGICLLVHATNQFGVSYFGQVWVSWYLVFGIIGGLPDSLLAASPLFSEPFFMITRRTTS